MGMPLAGYTEDEGKNKPAPCVFYQTVNYHLREVLDNDYFNIVLKAHPRFEISSF